MEIRVLRYFLEAAREESITRAAERLHISQPTLSKQLKDLEDELGQKLFTRTNYSIRITEAGMLLRKRAEDILDMVDKTASEFQSLDMDIRGDIHIGCAESDGIKHLARCLDTLHKVNPGIRYHLHSGNTEDIAGRLDKGILDFAIIAQNVDLSKYNYLELPHSDIWGIIMRQDSPLADKKAIQAEDLLDLPLICSRQGMAVDYPKFFGEKVDALNVVATFNLVYNAAILVREGLGYAFSFDKLVDTSPDSGLCFRPLSPVLETKMYVIWKKYQMFSPAAELLLKEMKEQFSKEYPEMLDKKAL
ncbi:MAG: LysR family transcriptional regulator [Lachnospiraceae bacterium]|nr:LysR family transcriptional regulator [Lachnospiraceae bacterium]MCM1238368.1 LysR family transcriptional regulator [Lachnospiraceae bacterium]